MAPPKKWFPIWIVLCIDAGIGHSFVHLKGGFESHGRYGQQSMIECVVETEPEAADAEIQVITWRKRGNSSPLIVYNKGVPKILTPGFQLAEPQWDVSNRNISLLVTNTKVTDAGIYDCFVLMDSGDDTRAFNFTVTAKYTTPTINSIPEQNIPVNTDVTLFCNSSSGYPKGQIHWFDHHGSNWTKSSEMEASLSDEGLFSLHSKLTLLRGSISSTYRCSVHCASGEKEGEVMYNIPFSSKILGPEQDPDKTSKIVAPVVVIGSLIVGLLCAVLFFRRRSQRFQQPHQVPSDDEDLERNSKI